MRINIEIPKDIHSTLKARAAMEQIPLKKLIIELLKRYKHAVFTD